MEYKIIWSIKAAGQMRSFDRSVVKRIHEKVDQLYQNPEILLRNSLGILITGLG